MGARTVPEQRNEEWLTNVAVDLDTAADAADALDAWAIAAELRRQALGFAALADDLLQPAEWGAI